MLSRREVASKLGVSLSTIDRWIKERKIPYLNLNGIVRFDSQVVDSWLEKRKVKAKSFV